MQRNIDNSFLSNLIASRRGAGQLLAAVRDVADIGRLPIGRIPRSGCMPSCVATRLFARLRGSAKLVRNEPQTEAEVERLRECLRRGQPFGSLSWMTQTAAQLGLQASLRPLGRPRKPKLDLPSLFDKDTNAELCGLAAVRSTRL